MKFAAGNWLVLPEPRPEAALRLLCFHHSGGGAFGFREWPRRLRRDVEVIAVQLPGRENRYSEPPARTAEEVFDGLVPRLKPILGAHYAVFGHSLGALLGARFIHRVQQTGELPRPTRLIASAAPAPRRDGGDLESVSRSAEPLTDEALIRRMERLGGTPAALLHDSELMKAFLPALRADYELLFSLPRLEDGTLEVPVTAIRGGEDPAVTAEAAAAWPRLSTRPSQTYTVTGGHFYLQTSPGAAFEIINAALGVDIRGLVERKPASTI